MYLDDLKSSEYLWVASVGFLDYSQEHIRWADFIIPTLMKIKHITPISPPKHLKIEYCDRINIVFEDWDKELYYKIEYDNSIEKRYNVIIDVEEDYVLNEWLHQLRKLLKDTWSGINNNNLNGILKKHILDTSYEYFAVNYPELLV
jgi:hypothetical protein